MLFFYVVVSLVISIDQNNSLNNEQLCLVYHQFDGKSSPSVCHQVFKEVGSMMKV